MVYIHTLTKVDRHELYQVGLCIWVNWSSHSRPVASHTNTHHLQHRAEIAFHRLKQFTLVWKVGGLNFSYFYQSSRGKDRPTNHPEQLGNNWKMQSSKSDCGKYDNLKLLVLIGSKWGCITCHVESAVKLKLEL
jgi:hypothetical protein